MVNMTISAVSLCLFYLSSTLAYTVLPMHGRLAPLLNIRPSVKMGLFDAFSKAFSNVDYSDSPATYEQTNARASHILVADLSQVIFRRLLVSTPSPVTLCRKGSPHS